MKSTAKRGKNVFDSAFPSDEELRYLEDTFQWKLLEKRLGDRNVENAIAAAKSRGDQGIPVVPKDIFRLFLLGVNAPQLLDLASKSSMVAAVLSDPKFWFQKLGYDFPELEVPFTLYDSSSRNPIKDEENGNIVQMSILDMFGKEIHTDIKRLRNSLHRRQMLCICRHVQKGLPF